MMLLWFVMAVAGMLMFVYSARLTGKKETFFAISGILSYGISGVVPGSIVAFVITLFFVLLWTYQFVNQKD